MIRVTLTYTDECGPATEHFADKPAALAFAEAMRAEHPSVVAKVTQGCIQCGEDHDLEDEPAECEDCGVCLGAAWDIEDGPICAECAAAMNECACPGGEELGPCSCPACAGGGKGR